MGLLFLTLVCIFVHFVNGCPPDASILPHCKCKATYDGNVMLCRGLLSPSDLITPIRELARSNTKLFSLSIDNSSLQYIPDKLFSGLHIERIRFLTTQLMSLSDSDVAFAGLEDTLTEIRATDAHYIAQWDWQQLKNLRALVLIDVNWIVMGSIVEPFPELPNLTHLGITRAEISYIADDAFAKFHKLRVCTMKENEIKELKRNMFPNPANFLVILDFSDNRLAHLPEDFFDGMPNLSDVMLMKNNFVTLHEKPFSKAFEYLQDLIMTDNPFRCDCRMRWLVGMRKPMTFTAVCSSPENLSGWSVKNLDLRSLWC